MTPVPPPLRSFLLYHRSMREGARALVKAAGAGRTEDVASWFDWYRRACLIHAEGEDGVLWPALAARRSGLDDVFDRMHAEHAELEQLLAELDEAVHDAGRAGDVGPLAERLVELVDRHLEHEETAALPPLVEAAGDELGDLMRQVQQSAGPDGAATAVPFLLEHASDEERAEVLAMVPPPVREAYETQWRAAYAAIAI